MGRMPRIGGFKEQKYREYQHVYDLDGDMMGD
jgi:hypothetical protein